MLANGGVLSYQHVICLSKDPRRDGVSYPEKNPLPEKITDVPIPALIEHAEGEATIEVIYAFIFFFFFQKSNHHGQTYTIEYNRDGSPAEGYIIGRLKGNNSRFLSVTADQDNLQQLAALASSDEPIGKTGFVYVEDGPGIDPEERKNLFTFGKRSTKL